MTLTKITSDGITDATIVNADINASAAIAGTKVSPNFGSQNILTTGKLGVGTTSLNNVFPITVQAQYPGIQFLDAQGTDSFGINADGGVLKLQVGVGGSGPTQILQIATASTTVTNNLNANAGLDVAGNITVSGTVDGVDLAALNTTVSGKLSNVVEDTTPQLGGDLDMNSKSISSGILGIKNTGSQSEVRLYCEVSNAHYVAVKAPPHAQFSGNPVFQLPPNGGTNGYFLKTNGSGVTSWSAVTSDLVNDTSPELGGDLQSNGNDIDFADNDKANFGTGNDLKIYYTGTQGRIENAAAGELRIQGDTIQITDKEANDMHIECVHDGAVKLYHDNSKKFETTSGGATVHGGLTVNSTLPQVYLQDTDHNSDYAIWNHDGTFRIVDATNSNATRFTIISDGTVGINNNLDLTGHLDMPDSSRIKLGDSDDLQIYHDGNNNYIKGINNDFIYIATNNVNRWSFSNDGHFRPDANNTYDIGSTAQRVRNIYTNDLNLSNEGGSNDVDGTWGNYTIQEGAEDLFLINKRNGKKYKFNLTEVS